MELTFESRVVSVGSDDAADFRGTFAKEGRSEVLRLDRTSLHHDHHHHHHHEIPPSSLAESKVLLR